MNNAYLVSIQSPYIALFGTPKTTSILNYQIDRRYMGYLIKTQFVHFENDAFRLFSFHINSCYEDNIKRKSRNSFFLRRIFILQLYIIKDFDNITVTQIIRLLPWNLQKNDELDH